MRLVHRGTSGESMRNWGLRGLCLAGAIMLGACETPPPGPTYSEKLESWVGHDADELVSSWGPPDSAYQLNDGGLVIEYVDRRTVTTGGMPSYRPMTTYDNGSVYGNGGVVQYGGTTTTYVPTTTPVRTHDMHCTTRFTADAQNIIVHWSYKGNDCE